MVMSELSLCLLFLVNQSTSGMIQLWVEQLVIFKHISTNQNF